MTAKLDEIKAYIAHSLVPAEKLVKMAKLGMVIDDWMAENDLDATAIQCWNSLQENYGVNVCTLMSMMSSKMMPSACEVDITGVASMYALQLASGEPARLVDWNNNYGDDPDKCVLFHCGNWANFCPARDEDGRDPGHDPRRREHLGRRHRAHARRSADHRPHQHRRRQRQVQGLRRRGPVPRRPAGDVRRRAPSWTSRTCSRSCKYICKNGFEHHAAMNPAHTADAVAEAFETYFDWDVYVHEG